MSGQYKETSIKEIIKDVEFGHRQVGNPAKVLDCVALNFPIFNEVDQHILIAIQLFTLPFGRVAPVRLTSVVGMASIKFAPLRLALDRSAPVIFAPVKLTPLRFA